MKSNQGRKMLTGRKQYSNYKGQKSKEGAVAEI